jgi:O-antigen/teichoic acid export membrane protein
MINRRRLLGESLVLIVIRALGVLLQLMVTVLLARHLSLSDMGLYALFFATVGIARALGPLGLDQASTRLLAVHSQAGMEDARVREYSLAGGYLTLIIAMLTALCTALILGSGLGPAGYGTGERLLFVIGLPAFVGIGLMLGQLRGLGYNLWAQAPDALGLQVITLTLVGSVAVSGEVTLRQAMAALVASGWLVLAFQLGFRIWLGGFRPGPVSGQTLRELMREGWAIFQAHSITVAVIYFPIYFAAATLGAGTVAILDIAQRFGNLGTLVTASIGATYNPTFARLSGAGDSRQLLTVVRDAGFLSGLPAVAIALTLLIFGKAIVGSVLPSDYLVALVPMTIIAAGTAVNALLSPASNVFLMSGQAGIVRRSTFLALIVVALGCWACAPQFGATGVALAILAGRLVRDGSIAATLWQRLRH